MKNSLLLATLALGASAFILVAQDAESPRPGGPRGPGPRPVIPVLGALDANKDGVIDATEIANAAAALKALDKNGDGQLTHDEVMPARPEGSGPGAGPGAGPGRGPGKGRPAAQ